MMGFATSALQHHHLLAAAGETWRVARGLDCSLLRKPFLPQRHHLLPQRKQPATRRQACCAQKKGFGSGSKTKSKRKRSGPALQESNPEWVPVAMVSEFKDGKDTLPKILRDNSAIVLYQVGREIYCSDANSTAFKFPLIDANVIEREDGPAVEVPLDGTVYDLETGEVLEWCPRNNPVRFVLGALKEKSQPKNLRVYPARVNGEGKIFVKFAPDSAA